MPLGAALDMLEIVFDKDFEEKAFLAWCASGEYVTFGEYLRQAKAAKEPPKSREEIYAEIDEAFEGW